MFNTYKQIEDRLDGYRQIGIGHRLILLDRDRDIVVGKDLFIQIEIGLAIHDDTEILVCGFSDYIFFLVFLIQDRILDHKTAVYLFKDIFRNDESFDFMFTE